MTARSHEHRGSAARYAIPLLVALVTFTAFLPALNNGFVSWDDHKNFIENPHYRGLGWDQLTWMWTTFHMGHYVPLSWMTLGLDHVLWGMNPVGYHLANLLLHAANAVLLYFLARRLLRRAVVAQTVSGPLAERLPAACAALLFALHPLRVESVAWVTERRDVLSLLFYLLSVLSYLRWVEGGAHARRQYWLAVATFLCALLSKATAMTVPAVLVVLNVFPLARLGGPAGWWTDSARRVYRELIPFAILAAASMGLSIVALHLPDQLDATAKLAVSAYSLAFYLWKTVAPVRLSPLYEMPQQVNPAAVVFVVSYVVAIALLGVAWLLRRRSPGATAGIVAFLVIILPMLGFVQNGPQIAADRYTYHAAPALAILAAAGFWRLERPTARARVALAVGALLVLGALTWRQTTVWHDSERLWLHALAVDSQSGIAHSALASQLFTQNRLREAIEHSERAVALAPGYAEGHNDLGVGLARQGHIAEAIEEYQRALALQPVYDEAENNLGVVIVRQGDLVRGIERFQRALAANPDNADAHVNWGNALVRAGNPAGAISHYQQALTIRPDHADAHHNWGVALARQGNFVEAIEQFQLALAINAQHPEAKQYLEQAIALSRRR